MTDSLIGRGWHKMRAAHATSFGGSSATANSFTTRDLDTGTTFRTKAALEAGGGIPILHHAIRDGDQQTARSAISCQLHESVAAQLCLSRSRHKRQGNQAQASDDRYRIWREPRDCANTSPSIAVVIAFPRSLQRSDT